MNRRTLPDHCVGDPRGRGRAVSPTNHALVLYPQSMSERIELELDAAVATYLRQRCVRRGDLAEAAAAALRELALRDAVTALANWHHANPDYAMDAVRENEQALAEAL
jgi:hypothetical protein